MTEQTRYGATTGEGIEKETMRKVIWRILPFLIVSYLISIIDRGNIGMASLQMNEDLGLSKAAFGFASSLYFVAYFCLKFQAIWRCKSRRTTVDPAHYDQLGRRFNVYVIGSEHYVALYRTFSARRC